MAQIVSVRLNRNDSSPWGFRLQGGKDFGQPLLIQKVNGGSLAEKAGLQVGDALIKVNTLDVQDLRHKDAQDTIVRAGNTFELQVQRGGSSTWKPQVSAVGQVPTPGSGRSPQTVTKTSLAAKPSTTPIPSGHNISPKPFGGSSTPQMNGGDSVKAIVNKQYNTPVGMYSEETIAETLSAQAEVLAGGVLGVNFMKNERTYDSQKSEVFKMLQEAESEPREIEPDHVSTFQATTPINTVNTPLPISGLRHVAPPEAKPPSSPQTSLPPGQNICADCERLIVGVFVRIKDKNLHVECFKCATCGTSLKNVGYYNINNKLYCDIHAKMVARQNPPASNMEPVTVPPGGRVPSGAFTAPTVTPNLPSSFTSAPAPQSPQPGTIAPMPFHTSNAPGPKPFGSQAPASAPPTSVPFSAPVPPPSVPFSAPVPPPSNISTPKPQTEKAQPVVWPPPTTKIFQTKDPSCKKADRVRIKEPIKSETKIPILNVEDVDEMAFDKKKRMSLCSEEVCHISDKKIEKSGISSILECTEDPNRPRSPIPDREVTCTLVSEITKAQARSKTEKSSSKETYEKEMFAARKIKKEEHYITKSGTLETTSGSTMTIGGLRRSVSPEILDISTKPHEIRSLLPPASAVRPLSPKSVVVFPPEIPDIIRSRSSSPQPPAVTEMIVRYTPSPVPHISEERITKKITQENVSKLKEKKHHETKEEKIFSSEKKSTKKEKKLQEKTKDEKLQVQDKKKFIGKEIQQKHLTEQVFTKAEVEKIVQEELKKVLKISEKKEEKEIVKEMSVTDLPTPIVESGKMASALSVAPDKPFTPIPFPKPLELPSVVQASQIPKKLPVEKPVNNKPVPLPSYTKPYFPPPPSPPEQESKEEKIARAFREVGCPSPMTEALTIAPDRPYSPIPSYTKLDPPSINNKNSFKPIAEIPRNKKPITMLSALTVAPEVPFTVPGKTPIPTEHKVIIDDKNKTVPSAFKPLGNGSISCVIPKTAPLNKSSPMPYIPHPKMDSKFGIDKSSFSEAGMKKEIIKGFESTSAETDTSKYSHKSQFICESTRTQTHPRQEPQKERLRPITPVKQPKPPSGLHCPNLLPYYQRDIGEIPVRNRSISPVPHLIKAPAINPTNTPPPPSRSPAPVQNYMKSPGFWSHQPQNQEKTVDKYYKTSTLSSETSASTKTITNINKTTQVFKPATPTLSPQWRGEYVRSVQNLSPITVRLPSPQPKPSPPIGDTSQETGAKIKIKKSKGHAPVVTYEQDETQHSKMDSEKKGVIHVYSSRKGHLGEQTIAAQQQQQRQEIEQQYLQLHHSPKLKQEQTEEIHQTKQIEKLQQMKKIDGKQIHSQTYETTGYDSTVRDKHLEMKAYVSSADGHSQISYGREKNYITAGEICKGNICYSSKSEYDKASSLTAGSKYDKPSTSTYGLQSSDNETKKSLKSYQTDYTSCSSSCSKSHELCGVNPSSSGGHAGGGMGSGSAGGPGASKSGSVAGSTAPRRGRGVLNTSVPVGGRIPLCGQCNAQIRGPFITALGKIWCPEHFVCVNAKCRRPLQDIGFVEEADGLYCEYCFEQYLAPSCDKCNSKIKGDCLNAIGKHFHPECFRCAYCEKLFGNNPFFLEDALPYCETDWNELFTTKCFSCGFPIEAGDRWVEALNNNYHSQCFNCTMCKKNLEGQSFYAKGGRPYCKNHAR